MLDLSPPSASVSFTRLAENGRGDAVAVWTSLSDSRDRALARVMVGVRGAGATSWTTEPVDEPSTVAAVPSVAIDAAGDAVVVWERRPNVWARVRDRASGRWSDAALLSSHGGGTSGPRVVASPGGHAVAIWAEGRELAAARREPGGDRWTALAPLMTDVLPVEPALAIDGNGDATVTYLQRGNPSFYRVARLALADRSWQLEPGGASSAGATIESAPSLAVDGAGNVLVVWAHDYVRGTGPIVRGSRRSAATGEWKLLEDLSEPGAPFGTVPFPNDPEPRVALDGSGNATVVWSQITPDPTADPEHPRAASSRIVQIAGVDADAKVTKGRAIHDASLVSSSPAIAVGERGSSVVVWSAVATNGGEELHCATRSDALAAFHLTTLSTQLALVSYAVGLREASSPTATVLWAGRGPAPGSDVVRVAETLVR